jgi:hypothetical protein
MEKGKITTAWLEKVEPQAAISPGERIRSR